MAQDVRSIVVRATTGNNVGKEGFPINLWSIYQRIPIDKGGADVFDVAPASVSENEFVGGNTLTSRNQKVEFKTDGTVLVNGKVVTLPHRDQVHGFTVEKYT